MTLDRTVIKIRLASGAERVVPLDDVGARHFDDAVPWRQFRWYRGQLHLPGSYWSARMEAPVGYESQLEMMNLILTDFDPEARFILSQPFLLEGPDGKRDRLHVPDYLVRLADGTIRVIDVKPTARLDSTKVRESLGWTRRLLEPLGWEYVIRSEPARRTIMNVRFLSGFRRDTQFPEEEWSLARTAIGEPMAFDDAVSLTSSVVGGARRARAVLLHLLWRHSLRVDVSRPLGGDSLVVPA